MSQIKSEQVLQAAGGRLVQLINCCRQAGGPVSLAEIEAALGIEADRFESSLVLDGVVKRLLSGFFAGLARSGPGNSEALALLLETAVNDGLLVCWEAEGELLFEPTPAGIAWSDSFQAR